MFAVLAVVAFALGLILRLAGAGAGHFADPWTWAFTGLVLLALHTATGYVPWRR